MAGKFGAQRLPPYISYRTFRNFLEDLRAGIPDRIDRSYWGDRLSGSYGIQLMTTMRFFNLIDGDNKPTGKLVQLVNSEGDRRKAILRNMTAESYPSLFEDFEIKKATLAQLKEKFEEYGAEGDVARKCQGFFTAMANDAGIEISPHILKKVRSVRAAYKAAKAKKKASAKSVPAEPKEDVGGLPGRVSWEEMLLRKFPDLDPSWSDELRKKWFDAFGELMRQKPEGLRE